MSKRNEHFFQFNAAQIAKAAASEAEYHERRVAWWQAVYDASVKIVEGTIGAKLQKQQVTGGYRVDVVVNYGDPAAYNRMQESFNKITNHRLDAAKYRTDERVYATQGERVYELSTEDVHYYRLGQPARENDD